VNFQPPKYKTQTQVTIAPFLHSEIRTDPKSKALTQRGCKDTLAKRPQKQALSRVARWHIFKPKIPIWVNLEGLAKEHVGVFFVS
jgi:hypothetical protein